MNFDIQQYATIPDLIQVQAQLRGDELLYRFLRTGDPDGPVEEWTFADLDRRARGVAALLQEIGAAGERALLVYPPGLEFIEGFMGCLCAGVTAVPTYPPDPTRLERTLPRLRAIAQDAGARFVLTTTPILAMATAILPAAPQLAALRWLATDALSADLAAAFRPVALDGDSLAFLQYTSGSTGDPRGVMVTHANAIHNERAIAKAFRHDASSRGVGWLPLFHDMGLIGNVLQPLHEGFSCTLMSPLAFLQQPLRWLKAISKFQATSSGGPNFAYELCVRKVRPEDRASLDLSSWTVAFNGAEPIRDATLDRFHEAFAPSGFRRDAFYPCYGLAESTLIVSGASSRRIPVVRTFSAAGLAQGRAEPRPAGDDGEKTRALVSSGQAGLDQRIVVVDPITGAVLPDGRVGEIWLSSPSVARGYWGRLDETAWTFEARLPGGEGPFLRTGDLGFLQGGELFVTGRLKDVIIIRGRNHFPQDLEQTVEAAHPAVRPGCVAAFALHGETGDGAERLGVAAEIDPARAGGDLEAVGRAIQRAVSDGHGLAIGSLALLAPQMIPKTSSGKLQRRATCTALASGSLPVIARIDDATEIAASDELASAGSGGDGIAVRDALAAAPVARRSELLLALLRHELARELRQDPAQIPLAAAAAELGLDSLGMLAVQGRLETALDMPVPAALLWRHATLAAAAEELASVWDARSARAGRSDDGAASADDAAAVSSGQARLWFLDRLLPDSAVYNVSGGLRLSGPLDEAALGRSLTALVERHAVLRTTFIPGDDGMPRAVIAPPAPLALATVEAREDALRALCRVAVSQPFDLAAGPLLRVTLVRLADEDHALLLAMHHTVTDGWSMGVLVRELAALYRQARRGEPASLPPAPRYDEYARRSRAGGDALDAQRAFWKRTLGGLPRLELPMARARSGPPSPRGATHRFSLPAELVDRVREIARQRGTTLFAALLASFTALLHRYSGQRDIAIGTVAANRGRPEHRDLVGFLANTLVLRLDAARDPSFVDLIDRSRRTVSEALAHAELPFDDVVRLCRAATDLEANPLFQAAFLMESLPPLDLDIPGMTWTPFLDVPDGSAEDTAKFDLALIMAEPATGSASLACQYNVDRFDEASIQRLALHFEVLLRALCEAPARPVSSLALLTEPERRCMLETWNATAADYPRHASIHRLFAEQAMRTPDHPAVTFDGAVLSYAELDRRSSQLAARLVAAGVGREARVGLYLERSAELVVGLLGILKSGAAYVPLDPAYPAERVAFVLADAGVSAIVTQEHLAVDLPDPCDQGCPVLVLDEAGAADELDATAALVEVDPGALAYVMYTSGSTGRPKGVMVTHRSVVNLITAMDGLVGAEPPGVFLALASVAFDVSVLELLWTLTRGFHVVVHPEQRSTAIVEQIAAHGVTHLQCTPSLAQILLLDPGAERALAGLRALLVAGEALPVPLAARLNACAPGRVMNLYGPTETTIYSSTHRVQPDETGGVLSIGTPIGNTALYVLDAHLEPVPVGIAGELYIGGAGLARGYHGRAGLTAERFVPDPFAGGGARMYRTGDLARFRDDGSLDFLGRADQQIKLRGYRIELGEIEATLAEHPGVREVAVAICEKREGDQRLVAYVVPRGATPPDAEELRRLARQRLPDYMVPSAVIALPVMPMTPNGKLDRKALPALGVEPARPAQPFTAARDDVERGIAEIWASVLSVPEVGIHDNFFALGGHSLLLAQVHAQVRARFQADLPLVKLIEHPTVSALARYLSEPPPSAAPATQLAQDRARQQMEARRRRQARRKP